jgi:hypothetical protein
VAALRAQGFTLGYSYCSPDGEQLRVGLIAVRAGAGLRAGHTAILTFLALFGSSQKEQRQNYTQCANVSNYLM